MDKLGFRLFVLLALACVGALAWIESSGLGILHSLPKERFSPSRETIRAGMMAEAAFATILYLLMLLRVPSARYVFLLWVVWLAAAPFIGSTYFAEIDGGLLSPAPILPPLEFAVFHIHALAAGFLAVLSFTTTALKE